MDLIPSGYNLFTAFWIIAGFWLIGKLTWMVIYEIKYGKGEDYINGKFKRKTK